MERLGDVITASELPVSAQRRDDGQRGRELKPEKESDGGLGEVSHFVEV